MSIHTLRDEPALAAFVRRALPDYRKHKVIINVATSLELHDTYWSGGTRASYMAYDLATGASRGAPQYAPPQFGGPRTSPRVEIPEGVVIIQTGYFCGKVATATIHVHPSNMPKLLAAAPAVQGALA
jgi:hypothetical protein